MKVENSKLASILTEHLRKADLNSKKIESEIQRSQQPVQDSVQISARKEFVSRLVEKVKEVADIREEKVRDVKLAMEKGEYRIDAQAVARNILRENLLDEIVE